MTNALTPYIIDSIDNDGDTINFYDFDKLNITFTSVTALINSIPDWVNSPTAEDAADLFQDLSTIFSYLAADKLNDVYEDDEKLADDLDHMTTELHHALTSLDNNIDLSALIR